MGTAGTVASSAMRNKILAACIAGTVILLTACDVQGGDTQAVPVSRLATPDESTLLATPVPLPFENPFPNRWNESNDGSPFEPCNAFSSAELLRFQIDPEMIEDAAIVDGQGIRGCRWMMTGRFSFSNLVTNSESLEIYRQGVVEYDWQSDLEIEGRTVGLFSLVHGSSKECSTYVQSYSAAVVTNVLPSASAEGKAIDACKLAVDFTRAYIDKIPG